MLRYMSWPFNLLLLLDAYRHTQLETSGRSLSNMTHAASPKNLRQMAKNLSDTDDGQVFSIDDNFATGSAHAFATRAKEFKLPGLCGGGALPRLDGAELRPHTSAHRLDQLRAIHFAGSFAGRDQNLHGTHCNGLDGAVFGRAFSRPRSP